MAELFSGLQFQEWWRSSSGLIVPSSLRGQALPEAPAGHEFRHQSLLVARKPEPLPNVATYATPEAMRVRPIPFEDFRTILSEIPHEIFLPILSDLQARLWGIETDTEKQLKLAEGIFGDSLELKRMKQFAASGPGRKIIFSEQALTLLQWLAIADCNEGEVEGLDFEIGRRVQVCLFGVPSYLEIVNRNKSRPDADAWLRHFTQNFAFNGHLVQGNALARTWLILGRLHRSAVDLRPQVELDEWFEEDYGLSLEQQMALGFALFARLSNQGGEEEAEYGSIVTRAILAEIFSNLGFGEKECNAAEDLISAPLSWYRDQVNGKTVSQLSWDQVPFMQRPLIRMGGGRYLLQSPRALHAWMIDGPYYRGLDCARARGDKAVSDYTSRVGNLTERYVLELTEAAHRGPRLPGAGEVHGDKTYGRGTHSSDVTITYPNEAVLIEVSSHRLTLEAKRDGDPEALRNDLTEMVGRRPRQLLRCIEGIRPLARGRAATLRFKHLEPERIARFWPIIATVMPVHWSPPFEDFLDPELQQLEERQDVEALDVMAIEDLEALLGIAERTGQRLADLLAAKAAALGPHGDVRTWVTTDPAVPNLSRPKYLDDGLTEILDISCQLLGVDVDDEDQFE
jgi:hypothetical protein